MSEKVKMIDEIIERHNKNSKESLSPRELFDKAISYMAARWLTIGSPNREQLSREFCDMNQKEQEKGIKVRRVNQTSISDYLSGFKECESELKKINNGNVPEEFLLPEETIPFETLEVMMKHCWDRFAYKRVMSSLSDWSGGSWHGLPFGFKRLEDHCFQNFDLPWMIAESVKNSEIKKFFNELQEYLFHIHGKVYYFVNPNFDSGCGDASARQNLLLFENGSFAHLVDNGTDLKKSGIYNPSDSEINILSEGEFQNSPVEMYVNPNPNYFARIPVQLMNKDTIYLKRFYPNFSFYKKGSIISGTGILVSDPELTSTKTILCERGRPKRRATYWNVVYAVCKSLNASLN